MLDVRTYIWKDINNTKIVVNSIGTEAKLSELADNSEVNPVVTLENILKLYGFTNIQISNPTGRNIIFSYDSKYNFLIIQLQNLTINMNVDILNGVIYWKPFQGASTTDYKTWDITNGSLKKTFSTNGEEIYLGYVAVCLSKADAYSWDNGKFSFSDLCLTPLQYVSKEGNEGKNETINSNLKDKYGDSVKYSLLNKISSYWTVPKYYIQTNTCYRGIRFNQDFNKIPTAPQSGKYVFSDDFTSYWGMYPEIYPIVVYDTCNSYDVDTYYGRPMEHTFSYNDINKTLQIDSKKVSFDADRDILIFYKREQGSWVVDESDFTPLQHKDGSQGVADFSDINLKGTSSSGTLTMPDITGYRVQIYDTLNYSFKGIESQWESIVDKLSLTPIDNPVFYDIISTKNQFELYLDWAKSDDSDYDWATKGFAWISEVHWFHSIGTFTYDLSGFDQSVENIKHKSSETINLTVKVKNYKYIDSSNTPEIPTETQNKNTSVKIDDWDTSRCITNMTFKGYFASVAGFLPQILTAIPETKYITNEQSGFELIGGGLATTYHDLWNRHSNGKYEACNLWGNYGGGYGSKVTAEYGYWNYSEEATFGFTAVVWRNGKALSVPVNSINTFLYTVSKNNDNTTSIKFINGTESTVKIECAQKTDYSILEYIPAFDSKDCSIGDVGKIIRYFPEYNLRYVDPTTDETKIIYLKDL